MASGSPQTGNIGLALYCRLESEPLSDEVLRRDHTREMVNATMSQPRYLAEPVATMAKRIPPGRSKT